MKISDFTTKERFEDFCKKEFPGKKIKWNEDWCFVQAGTHLGDNLHYEFNKERVSLHIEGTNWRGIRDYLNSKQPFPNIKAKWWNRQNCCWELTYKVENETQLFSAFRYIRNTLEPHILDYEKTLKKNPIKVDSSDKSHIKSSIISVEELLKEDLSIPTYQRPYRWTIKNVRNLLEDINTSLEKGYGRYRIGSVILHANGENLDLVDGQQRVTTINLILKACNQEFQFCKLLKFNHRDSFVHIKVTMFATASASGAMKIRAD